MRNILLVAVVFFLFLGIIPKGGFAEAPTLEDLVTAIGPCRIQVADAAKVRAVIEFLEGKRTVRPTNVSLAHINMAISYMISQDVLFVENQLKNSPSIDPKMIKALQDRLTELDGRLKDDLVKLASQMTSEHQQINTKLCVLAGDIDKLSVALCAILGEQQKQIDCLLDKANAANDLLNQINSGVNSANQKLDNQTDALGRLESGQENLADQNREIIGKTDDIHADTGYIIGLLEPKPDPDFVLVSLGGFYRIKENKQSQLREYCFDINLRAPILGSPEKAFFVGLSLGNIYAALSADAKIKVGPIGILVGGGGNYMPQEEKHWHSYFEGGLEYKRAAVLVKFFVEEEKGKTGIQFLLRFKAL